MGGRMGFDWVRFDSSAGNSVAKTGIGDVITVKSNADLSEKFRCA